MTFRLEIDKSKSQPILAINLADFVSSSALGSAAMQFDELVHN